MCVDTNDYLQFSYQKFLIIPWVLLIIITLLCPEETEVKGFDSDAEHNVLSMVIVSSSFPIRKTRSTYVKRSSSYSVGSSWSSSISLEHSNLKSSLKQESQRVVVNSPLETTTFPSDSMVLVPVASFRKLKSGNARKFLKVCCFTVCNVKLMSIKHCIYFPDVCSSYSRDEEH